MKRKELVELEQLRKRSHVVDVLLASFFPNAEVDGAMTVHIGDQMYISPIWLAGRLRKLEHDTQAALDAASRARFPDTTGQ